MAPRRSPRNKPVRSQASLEARQKQSTRASRVQRRSKGDKRNAGVGSSSVKSDASSKTFPCDELPYHILFRIFENFILIDASWHRTNELHSLLAAAIACRAFTEPALSVLYCRPPITLPHQYKGFARLIRSDSPKTIDYRSKVRQLDFEINYTRFATIADDLHQLLELLPALRGFGLYQNKFQSGVSTSKLTPGVFRPHLIYRDSWLSTLRSVGLYRLKWHSLGFVRVFPARIADTLLSDGKLHSGFRFLKQLEIEWLMDREGAWDGVADALKSLPDLKSLIFTRCDLGTTLDGNANDNIIFDLPPRLTHLEFIDCGEFNSDLLVAALRLSGLDLRRLVLLHNRELSLDFLAELSQTCPKLEYFEYDLSLKSPLMVTSYTEPFFEELFPATKMPAWPPTLQRIEMSQLRKWDRKAAEVFFRSLLDSSSELRNLRRISISASIDAGWRERAKFREAIIAPLIQTYQRVSKGPDLALNTLHPQADEEPQRLGRAKELSSAPRNNSRPKRLARNSASLSKARQTEEGSQSQLEGLQLHGMCDYVYIKVDNLRPTEEQFNETHFQDSEQSGDEAYDPQQGDVDMYDD